jgi:hypothetical protein
MDNKNRIRGCRNTWNVKKIKKRFNNFISTSRTHRETAGRKGGSGGSGGSGGGKGEESKGGEGKGEEKHYQPTTFIENNIALIMDWGLPQVLCLSDEMKMEENHIICLFYNPDSDDNLGLDEKGIEGDAEEPSLPLLPDPLFSMKQAMNDKVPKAKLRGGLNDVMKMLKHKYKEIGRTSEEIKDRKLQLTS